MKENSELVYELNVIQEFSAPGVVEIKSNEGDQWILRKVN